jgi:uncharacterized protein YecE (DUF72 family)
MPMQRTETLAETRRETKKSGRIRVGVGGWTYEPWRGAFYPRGLVQKNELRYAAEHLTSIEINGTFYGTQKPESFIKWREETPDDFVFSIKAPRYVVQRRELAQTGESIARFMASGLAELGPKLGPILWQFAPTKKFDVKDFDAFLRLLPRELNGAPLRHALEVRHDSFRAKEFLDMARAHQCAVVIAGDSKFPVIADPTAPFVYLRVMGSTETAKLGYPPKKLQVWGERAIALASGEAAEGLPISFVANDRVPMRGVASLA